MKTNSNRFYVGVLLIALVVITSIVATAYVFIVTRNYVSFLLLLPAVLGWNIKDDDGAGKTEVK